MRGLRGLQFAQVLAIAGVLGMGGSAAITAPVAAALRLVPASEGAVLYPGHVAQPIPTSECEVDYGIACYEPYQMQLAYDLQPLFSHGINGRGSTIVIVDAFGSPTIQADLNTFDTQFGLPAPPSFHVYTPEGTIPPCTADPFGVADCEGWGVETSLDVEWSHVMAPDANIALVETPTSETEGVQGFPDIVAAENWAIDHHLGDVITQSFGATEQTFEPNLSAIYGLRSAYVNAQEHGVTVLAASGDDGATDDLSDGDCCYASPAINWPASDPLVTAVGGTMLDLNDAGVRLAPDVVWNDGYGASGGGHSIVFSRPSFQNEVAGVVGSSRGTPDISMSAAVNGGVWFYDTEGGWGIVGGTSEASPLFSGVIALADQWAGHSLGYINPALYQMAVHPDSGIVPITSGNNTFAGVTGFQADGFYNDATGWGTVDAAVFVPALARAVGFGGFGGY